MAYLAITRFTGDGDQLLGDYAQYADVMSGVGRTHGLLLHAGAKTDEGFLVVNLWPSRQCSEAAAATRAGSPYSSGPGSVSRTGFSESITSWRASSPD